MLEAVSVENVRDLDIHDWNSEFLMRMSMSMMKGEFAMLGNEEEFRNMMTGLAMIGTEMVEVLQNYPIVVPDSTMDEVFDAKVEDFKDFKLPYDAFCINKRFDLENGTIMGVYAMDLKPFLSDMLKKEGHSKSEIKKNVDFIIGSHHTGEIIKDSIIGICFIYVDKEGVFIISTYPKEIREDKWGWNEEEKMIIKKAYSFVFNVIPFLKEYKKSKKHDRIDGDMIRDLIGADVNNKVIPLSK